MGPLVMVRGSMSWRCRWKTAGGAVRGNLVPDAHLAGLLRQHGVGTLYTADADFRRFDFLRVRNPI